MATVAIYVRVSTEEQAQRGHSLREQEDVCRSYAAERLGCTDPLVIREEGVSGSIIERPGVQRLLALARDVDYVVCKDPDRLARNLALQLLITERIERQGARLVFVDFERSPTPEGRLFYAIRGAIAEFEREKIRQRTMAGKIRKAKEGGIPTNVPAYGYRQRNGVLEVDEVEAQVVRQIYDWFLNGLDGHPSPVPPGVIARHLNRLGIPTKRPGGRWQQATVREILLSPRYVGRWYFLTEDATGTVGNKFRPPGERVRRRKRDPSEWILVPIPAILPPEVWEQAQRAYRLGNRRRARPGPYRYYLLTGLASCGRCGHPVVGKSRAAQGRDRVRYYVCQLRNRRRACDLPYLRADPVEAKVWETVRGWVEHPETLRRYVARLADSSGLDREGEREAVEAALRRLRDERQRLVRLYRKSLVPEEELEGILEGMRRQEGVLLDRLATMPPGPAPGVSPEALATQLRPLLDAADPAARRRVLERMLDGVVIEGPTPQGCLRVRVVARRSSHGE